MVAQPQISPDGRWMAYMSNESSQRQVYVRPFPDVNKGRWQVSTSGGDSPLWSSDSRELFFRTSDAVMAVVVETEETFRAGLPKRLFQETYGRFTVTNRHPWDIRPDGKRFLMLKEPGSVLSEEGGQQKINVVVNWFEELKERVPVD